MGATMADSFTGGACLTSSARASDWNTLFRRFARAGELETLLAGCPVTEWLDCIRALVLTNRVGVAEALSKAAIAAYPDSVDLCFAHAGLLQQTGQAERTEEALRGLLALQPTHIGAAFLLARLLKDQGRMQAVAQTIRTVFIQRPVDVAEIIEAVELLDECNRKHDAAAICDQAIAAGTTDPRVYAYAGMLEVQLGAFDRARAHYAFVHEHSTSAFEWGMATGLSHLQRYRSSNHPDFFLFQHALNQTDLSDPARFATLFALAKAHDDIGAYAAAADYMTQANALAQRTSTWSRKLWRRSISTRLAKKGLPLQLTPQSEWTPIFIVGVPRSGSTLLAELLARHSGVCNRGELAWLPRIAQSLSLAGDGTVELFEQAASSYENQLRQDDTSAHWFIDKQPFNLLHVDLILALWPHARIIYCQRNPRDTALSLWSQRFVDKVQDYAYDLPSIALVIKDCRQLMAHWQKRYPSSIYSISYEQLAADPGACVAPLADWLGFSKNNLVQMAPANGAISTASLWQARQPIHTRSVERWRNYAQYLPELLRLPAI